MNSSEEVTFILVVLGFILTVLSFILAVFHAWDRLKQIVQNIISSFRKSREEKRKLKAEQKRQNLMETITYLEKLHEGGIDFGLFALSKIMTILILMVFVIIRSDIIEFVAVLFSFFSNTSIENLSFQFSVFYNYLWSFAIGYTLGDAFRTIKLLRDYDENIKKLTENFKNVEEVST